MRKREIDWSRVEQILGAKGSDQVGCPYCRDQGTVPYVAEHVLVTHQASHVARRLQQAILGHGKSRSA